MVSTRLSLCEDATPEATILDDNGQPKAVTRALKKLLIDANPALKGDQEEKAREEHAPKKVYHWRGAVYEMDDNTPQEWLDQEPERYQKRKRALEEHDSRDESVSVLEHSEPPAKRKRGRPRKHPLPDAPSPAPIPKKRKRDDSPVEYNSRERSSDKSRTARKTRSQGVAEQASKTPRERAAEKGYKVESISWADMMTGKIAVDLVKFCAVQSELRKLQAEYERVVKVHDQLLEQEKDNQETDYDDTTNVAPLTPEADGNAAVESPQDKTLDMTFKPERPDSGLSGLRRTPTPPRYDEFGPWDPPPRKDHRGRELLWSLRAAKDMEGRAEYHIYLGKMGDQEQKEQQQERINRELALIKRWETIDGGAAFVHEEDRARPPRHSSSGNMIRSPRRLTVAVSESGSS